MLIQEVRSCLGPHRSDGWVSSSPPKGCRFNSQSGYKPKLQVWSPVGGVQEATHQCFSYIYIYFSLSLFLSLSLKKPFKKRFFCSKEKQSQDSLLVKLEFLHYLYKWFVLTKVLQLSWWQFILIEYLEALKMEAVNVTAKRNVVLHPLHKVMQCSVEVRVYLGAFALAAPSAWDAAPLNLHMADPILSSKPNPGRSFLWSLNLESNSLLIPFPSVTLYPIVLFYSWQLLN